MEVRKEGKFHKAATSLKAASKDAKVQSSTFFRRRNGYVKKQTIISGTSALSAYFITGVLYPLELIKIRLQGLYQIYYHKYIKLS